MKHKNRKLLIEGDFSPARGLRRFRVLNKIMGLLLVVAIAAALIMYGITVQYEFGINETGREARSLYEQNRELQVALNRIKSYKNVETTAMRAPQLKEPDEVIEAVVPYTDPLPNKPVPDYKSPRIYGY